MLNLFQHPPCRKRGSRVEEWMLKQVQHDDDFLPLLRDGNLPLT